MAKQLDSGVISRDNMMAIIKYVGGGAAILAFGIFCINYFVPRVAAVQPQQIEAYDGDAAQDQLRAAADCSRSTIRPVRGVWFDEKLNFQRCYEGQSLNELNVVMTRSFRMIAQNSSRDATLIVTQNRANAGFATPLLKLDDMLGKLGVTDEGVTVTDKGSISVRGVQYVTFARDGGNGIAFSYHEGMLHMGNGEYGYRNSVYGVYFDAERDQPYKQDDVNSMISSIVFKTNPEVP